MTTDFLLCPVYIFFQEAHESDCISHADTSHLAFYHSSGDTGAMFVLSERFRDRSALRHLYPQFHLSF